MTHISRRLQQRNGFPRRYRTRRGGSNIICHIFRFSLSHAETYTLHRCAYKSHLSILLYWLFVGSALARLERSTLPEHKGTRTVVLRFLKIIGPVKCVMPLYDGFVCCPKEGELHRRKNKVWNRNIDKSKATKRGLQLLWDTWHSHGCYPIVSLSLSSWVCDTRQWQF